MKYQPQSTVSGGTPLGEAILFISPATCTMLCGLKRDALSKFRAELMASITELYQHFPYVEDYETLDLGDYRDQLMERLATHVWTECKLEQVMEHEDFLGLLFMTSYICMTVNNKQELTVVVFTMDEEMFNSMEQEAVLALLYQANETDTFHTVH